MFPYHNNVGDSAIWLGTSTLLKKLGIKLRYACSHVTYNPNHLKKCHPDGPILILGGGNFGDVYKSEFELRKRIILDFPGREIIQLPQSIWFRSPESVTAWQKILANHGNFTLLVRDNDSYKFSKDNFEVNTRLCPDMAFCLNQKILRFVNQNSQKTKKILCIMRNDGEKLTDRILTDSNENQDYSIEDWKSDVKSYRQIWSRIDKLSWKISNLLLISATKKHGAQIPMSIMIVAKKAMADLKVKYGIKQIQQGSVIVTDRLHVALLSWLVKKEVVLLDNCYNKNSNFFSTWFESHQSIKFANNFEMALELARVSSHEKFQ